MEGWKFSVALAFLLVACAVQASPNIGQRTCEQIPCSQHSDGRKFADPASKCGYCCCVDNNGYAKTHKCVDGGLFNEATQKCEGEHRCGECADVKCEDPCLTGWIEYPVRNPHNPDCGYCLCPKHGFPQPRNCSCGHKFDEHSMDCVVDPTNKFCPCDCNDLDCAAILKDGQKEVRIPNPNNRCGFCCCRWDDNGRPKMEIDTCPFHEMYDATTNDCIPDPTGYCKDPSTPPTPPTPPTRHTHTYPPPTPPGKGGCETVSCPTNPIGTPLYACPSDPQSYCQCDWGGHAHQMPCSPGTIFDSYEQVCV